MEKKNTYALEFTSAEYDIVKCSLNAYITHMSKYRDFIREREFLGEALADMADERINETKALQQKLENLSS